MNYFAVVTEMTRRAAAKRIELLPMPPERYHDPDTGVGSVADPFAGPCCAHLDTPRGHYVTVLGDTICIITVEDFRAGSGVYDDLVPGYRLEKIERLPALDADDRPMPEHAHRDFTSIVYCRVGI